LPREGEPEFKGPGGEFSRTKLRPCAISGIVDNRAILVYFADHKETEEGTSD